MHRYAWVVRALGPRDGGWLRFFGSFHTENAAWTAVEMFWDLITGAGDYETIDVVGTISLRSGNPVPA